MQQVPASAGDDISNTEAFFEMSLDHLCVAGLDGFFKRVNPAWTRTLGWTAVELLSRPSIEFVHPDDRATTLARRQILQLGGEMGPLTNRYICKDGTFRWFEWRSIAHLDRGFVYAAARDVTEERLAEARLAEAAEREAKLQRQLAFADRMTAIGTLAAGVAHEVNNPLACVTANIDLIIEELDRQPPRHSELREMAQGVHDAAARIRKILRGLKTFSRADEERPTVVDVHPLLNMAADITLSLIRDRVRVVKEYGEVPLVNADEGRLGEVFTNLLVNAAQALSERASETAEIRIVTTTDASGRAVIEVHDTGVGIATVAMARIFDPFFTTKAVGANPGLGLSICHGIVTGMGGEISAVSELGHGATFRVVLPAAPSARAELSPPPESPRAATGAKILIVDDEVAVGKVLARVLRGHDVTVVSSAKQGLVLLEAGKRFDVIFSDLMMPEVSGMDFYDEVARRWPEVATRIVFVSGGTFTTRANAFLDRVTNARLDKPFDIVRVRSLVQDRLAAIKPAV